MKKTLIALLALAGVASAAVVGRTETLWTMSFGTDIGESYTENEVTLKHDYLVTGSYKPSNVWDVDGLTGTDYVATNGSDKRVHIRWANGSGLSFDENWEVEIVFTLPTGYKSNSNYPALLALTKEAENGVYYGIRLSPYQTDNNNLRLDGYFTSEAGVVENKYLDTDKKYTATITSYEGAITLKLDGEVVQTRKLSDKLDSGDVYEMTLGGRPESGSDGRIGARIYSVSAYKVVPEPTTATLSLLALAGLAARRRRK